MQLQPRPLVEIELTGWRRLVRQSALVLVAMTAVGTGMAFLENASELVLVLVAAPAALLAFGAVRAMGRRYPSALWIGLASAGCALLLLATTIHRHASGDSGLPAQCSLALFLFGLLLIPIELVTHGCERARLRRDADPVFPAARVVER